MRDNTPKNDPNTEGGDPIADYIRADTAAARLSAVPPFPAENGDFPDRQAAVCAAVRPFHPLPEETSGRTTRAGFILSIPSREIAEILDKGSTTIQGALNELDTAGLLERERGGFSAPNRLYVKVPPVPQVQFSDQLMAGRDRPS